MATNMTANHVDGRPTWLISQPREASAARAAAEVAAAAMAAVRGIPGAPTEVPGSYAMRAR